MANKNDDVLLNLLNKHKEANGIPTEPTKPVEEPVEKIVEVDEVPVDANIDVEEDIYGVNDLMKQIEAEEAADKAAREAMFAARQQDTRPKELTMPDEKDETYLTEAVGYQGDKLSNITLMVNKVVAKYRLISGGIQDAVPPESRVLPKRAVMGELAEIYDSQNSANPIITPEFESIILSNWVMPDGSTAIENINENGVVVDHTIMPTETQEENLPATNDGPVEDTPAVININVEPNTPVEVNVDNELIASLTKTKKIDIYVNEISSSDMEASTIIENTDQEGIITTYDPGINDVPITLPLSGYRCVMRGINYLDFIKLSAPSSGNTTDAEIKTSTTISRILQSATSRISKTSLRRPSIRTVNFSCGVFSPLLSMNRILFLSLVVILTVVRNIPSFITRDSSYMLMNQEFLHGMYLPIRQLLVLKLLAFGNRLPKSA